MCNFYSSIKPSSLFSLFKTSSSGEVEKQALLPFSTWTVICVQIPRPRKELIFIALALTPIRKHDRLEGTSSECIHEAPYCGIPQIPIKLQKMWGNRYNSALCQPCKQEVLVYFSDLSVLNQHSQGALSVWASYLRGLVSMPEPRPQLSPCLTTGSPAGRFCPVYRRPNPVTLGHERTNLPGLPRTERFPRTWHWCGEREYLWGHLQRHRNAGAHGSQQRFRVYSSSSNLDLTADLHTLALDPLPPSSLTRAGGRTESEWSQLGLAEAGLTSSFSRPVNSPGEKKLQGQCAKVHSWTWAAQLPEVTQDHDLQPLERTWLSESKSGGSTCELSETWERNIGMPSMVFSQTEPAPKLAS